MNEAPEIVRLAIDQLASALARPAEKITTRGGPSW